jgi:hypothetical protein
MSPNHFLVVVNEAVARRGCVQCGDHDEQNGGCDEPLDLRLRILRVPEAWMFRASEHMPE